MRAIINGWAILRRAIVELGPYLMLELLLPGGTLLALTLFLCRRRLGESAVSERNPARALMLSISAIAKRR